jgi:hypothetical protein
MSAAKAKPVAAKLNATPAILDMSLWRIGPNPRSERDFEDFRAGGRENDSQTTRR